MDWVLIWIVVSRGAGLSPATGSAEFHTLPACQQARHHVYQGFVASEIGNLDMRALCLKKDTGGPK